MKGASAERETPARVFLGDRDNIPVTVIMSMPEHNGGLSAFVGNYFYICIQRLMAFMPSAFFISQYFYFKFCQISGNGII
jgi:hypothetical protein